MPLEKTKKIQGLSLLLVVVGGVMLTVILLALVLMNSAEKVRHSQEREIESRLAEMSASMNAGLTDVTEVVKLVYVAPTLSLQEFDEIGRQAIEHYPERRLLAWLPRLDNPATPVTRTVWPGVSLPVSLELNQPGEQSLVPGTDLLAEAGLSSSIMEAVNNNRQTVALRYADGDQYKTETLYLFEPVYARGEIPYTPAERRKQLRGVIMLKVDFAAWLENYELPAGMSVHLMNDDTVEHEMNKVFSEISLIHGLALSNDRFRIHASQRVDWSRLDYFAALLVAFVGIVVTWLAYRLLLAQFSITASLQSRYLNTEQKLSDTSHELVAVDALLQQQKLVLDEHSIVSTADVAGRITYVNDKFCEVSGFSREELMGQYHRIVKSDQHPDSFYKQLWKTISSGRTWQGTICNRCKDGSYYWVESTIKPFFDENGRIDHYISIRTDITAQIQVQKVLSEQRQLLDMVQNSMRYFVQVTDLRQLANSILKELCELTRSQFGLIGEVRRDEDNKPYFRVHAISDLAWDDKSTRLHRDNLDAGMEFRNLDNVLTRPLVTGEAYISNDVEGDQYSGGQPPGHPEISNYLGIPVFYGDELVGMYGIANHQGGFDEDMQAYLRPFTTAYGVMIHATRMRENEQHAQLDIIKAKNEAEAANQAKSEFLSRMSHELRTPLNAILGFSQLLRSEEDRPLDETQKENVAEIEAAGRHLLSLIEEILDLSRIESGRLELDMQAIGIAGVVQECQSLVSTLAQQHAVTISVDAASCDDTMVKADYTRLKQVVLNLLSNAVKYNRRGGSVSISCTPAEDNRCRLVVSDTGKGIAEHFHEDVFRPFSRMDATNSAVDGVGIGMAISKRFVEVMGGRIGFDSTEGQGSTFWIELERAGEDQTADNETNRERVGNRQDQASSSTDADSGRVFRLLYVEDNKANMRLMQHLMHRREDIDMLGAETGEDGVEMAINERPDIILMDINLPGINGYEAVAQIRQHPELENVPVIALSANAMPVDVEESAATGFKYYLTKPLNVSRFIEVLEATLMQLKNNASVSPPEDENMIRRKII